MVDPVGPLYYQCPEMLNKKYDDKCDVWSIGIVLYFILCGDLPFYGNDDAKVKFTILNGRLFFRQSIWSQRSQPCKDFIKLLLSPDLSTRPTCLQALEHPWLKQKEFVKLQLEMIDNAL